MRILGIDYGEKRVGIAISDERGSIAFPFKILKNDETLIDSIHNICGEEDISEIVIGKSLNEKGRENKIMEKINKFKKDLEVLNLAIHFENEFMSSIIVKGLGDKKDNNERKIKKEKSIKVDDRAASIILQRFLDKKNKNYGK